MSDNVGVRLISLFTMDFHKTSAFQWTLGPLGQHLSAFWLTLPCYSCWRNMWTAPYNSFRHRFPSQPLPAARRQCLESRQNLPSWPANCSLLSDCLSRIILSCLHSHHRARQWQGHWLIVCITKSFQERPRCLITLQTTSWATSRTFA